jgi:hypothetical protein
MNKIFNKTDNVIGMARTHRFSEISIPKYQQAKSTAKVSITPNTAQPIAK